MDLTEKRENRIRICFFVSILCLAINIVLYFYIGYIQYDLQGHWRICAYSLAGYNPFPLIGKEAALSEIGRIPEGFSTVPWACIFGNVFYPGFLPMNIAAVYIWVLHFAVLFFTAWLIFGMCRDQLQVEEKLTIIFLAAGQFSFMYSLVHGNNGAVISMLLIDVVLLCRKHPWIAGILLGIALMKPQISAIVCVVFLLNKQWKPLVPAGLMTILGYAATSVATGTAPSELLKGCLESGTASDLQYLGLFSFLAGLSVNRTVVLLINMITGVLYTVILWKYAADRVETAHCRYPAAAFMPAFVASTFWMYKNGTDYQLLSFVSIFLFLLITERTAEKQEFRGGILMILYFQMSRCIVYIAQVIISDSAFARYVFKGADGLLLAVGGIVFCRMWIRFENRQKGVII